MSPFAVPAMTMIVLSGALIGCAPVTVYEPSVPRAAEERGVRGSARRFVHVHAASVIQSNTIELDVDVPSSRVSLGRAHIVTSYLPLCSRSEGLVTMTIDGRPSGPRARVDPGRHAVEYRYEGSRSWDVELTGPTSLDVELQDAQGPFCLRLPLGEGTERYGWRPSDSAPASVWSLGMSVAAEFPMLERSNEVEAIAIVSAEVGRYFGDLRVRGMLGAGGATCRIEVCGADSDERPRTSLALGAGAEVDGALLGDGTWGLMLGGQYLARLAQLETSDGDRLTVVHGPRVILRAGLLRAPPSRFGFARAARGPYLMLEIPAGLWYETRSGALLPGTGLGLAAGGAL